MVTPNVPPDGTRAPPPHRWPTPGPRARRPLERSPGAEAGESNNNSILANSRLVLEMAAQRVRRNAGKILRWQSPVSASPAFRSWAPRSPVGRPSLDEALGAQIGAGPRPGCPARPRGARRLRPSTRTASTPLLAPWLDEQQAEDFCLLFIKARVLRAIGTPWAASTLWRKIQDSESIMEGLAQGLAVAETEAARGRPPPGHRTPPCLPTPPPGFRPSRDASRAYPVSILCDQRTE